jgi:hypothetical protein
MEFSKRYPSSYLQQPCFPGHVTLFRCVEALCPKPSPFLVADTLRTCPYQEFQAPMWLLLVRIKRVL